MKKERVDVEPGRIIPGMASRHKTAFVIFTDLDGTLLDARDYSFDDAREGLDAVLRRGIPCILCSSKTRAEMEEIRKRMGISDPFISENGGGIFIPPGNFPADIQNTFPPIENNFFVIRLGANYVHLRTAIKELRSEGFDVNGFGDMSPEQIACLTGLSEDSAQLAAQREFDEPFIFRGNDTDRERLIMRVQSKGLNIVQGGNFFHIMGGSDKGRAISILSDLYRKKNRGTITIGLGDAENDLPMLREVNIPIIVQKPDGQYDTILAREKFYKADGIGPKGWNKAILEMMECSGDISF